MTAIFKREYKSCFTGMIGWVIAAVSLFFLGLYYTNRNLLYASSDFATVLYTMTMILLFLLPAISMRSFAEERKNKTDQLLLTSPVGIPSIVAGKYLAEVAVFARYRWWRPTARCWGICCWARPVWRWVHGFPP